jgi:hypothetical protein
MGLKLGQYMDYVPDPQEENTWVRKRQQSSRLEFDKSVVAELAERIPIGRQE